MTDTPPEIAEMVRARLMALSGAERFRMGVQMFDAARRMVLASLPADLTETERNAASSSVFTAKPYQPRPGSKMKITKAKYAAEQGIAEEEALKKGMGEKSKEFAEKGSELYAKA